VATAGLASGGLASGIGREIANWMFPSFIAMVLAGFFAIWKFGSMPGNPNPVRALFIAMNAATLSGFGGDPGITPTGEAITLLLIIGGSLFSMIVGGLAVIRIARLPITDGQLIFAAVFAEAVALVVGTSLLWDSDRGIFQAAFLAASSFGNCGLYIGNLPGPGNILVHAVILPLTVLGGIGIPVLIELGRSLIYRDPMSAHSKATIGMSAWLYIIGVVLILALNQAGHGWLNWSRAHDQLPASSALAIESRTGGMPIASVEDLTQPARWMIVVLMIIGGGSAGTAGGVKVTTFVELFRGLRKLLAGENPGRPFAIAGVWLGVYAGIVLAAILLLSYVGGNDTGDNVLFNAVSAAGNVGFSAAGVPDQKSLFFAYSAIVLVGRMAPLMVLWWMADTTREAELAVG
jgi:trk system potassium uptake protein